MSPTVRWIRLPAPRRSGRASLERVLEQRRSVRRYGSRELTLLEVSQLLWAAQGLSGVEGDRTAPSAGALFPLEVLLLARGVADLPSGLYRYRAEGHRLRHVTDLPGRAELARAVLDQRWVATAPAVLVISAVYGRTTVKYGSRGRRYVHIEVGHAAQNVYLQAVSLGLGTVLVGAFEDEELRRLLGMPQRERPLGLLPVGPAV